MAKPRRRALPIVRRRIRILFPSARESRRELT